MPKINTLSIVSNLSLKIKQGGEDVFSVAGAGRFLISPEDGFRVVDLGMKNIDFYKLSIPISAGEEPDFSKPIEGNGSGSFGGTWSAGVKGDKAGVAFSSIFGGTTDASILNRLGYIDVTYYAPIGETVSDATILDDAPEFTLLGSAVQDAVFDRVQKLSDSRFRYYYKDSNPGNTTPPFKPDRKSVV